MTGPLRRYLRTPKGTLLAVFLPMLVVAGRGSGWALLAAPVAGAIGGGIALDLPILRWRKGRWVFPDGAILTGLIVAMVLSPHTSWQVAAATSALGVASKYLVRARGANVFNPAALALVISFYLFGAGESWWGALAEVPLGWIALLLAVGLYVTDRVMRLPAMLAFLGVYFALLTVQAFVGNPIPLAEVYRAPDLHAALYFAFFMVTDPPTSPAKPLGQVIFGSLTGVASYLAFVVVGAVWWLPGGLLVANAWEGWRKVRHRAAQRASLKAPATG